MANVKNRGEIYRCAICGNVVEVLVSGGGELVCCGAPMDLLAENTQDAALEKHVPVIEEKEDGYLVKIGSFPHPMEEAHFIVWIELTVDGTVLKKFLSPGEKPEALFMIGKGEKVSAREYCNIHGMWKTD